MARKTPDRDFSLIISAAADWIQKCLIRDGAVFFDEELWTQARAEDLKRHFVDALDDTPGKFLDKLKKQLSPANEASRRLMGEILWVLSLFPSNSGPNNKRTQLQEIWTLAGSAPTNNHPMVSDSVLSGIGSAGTAYLTQHWREVRYLIFLLLRLKPLERAEREAVFASYAALADWLEADSESASRQFPHMLRYFAFPEEVERISSTAEKQKILTGFGIQSERTWTNRKLDEELLALRRRLELDAPGKPLDFYNPPLVSRWKVAKAIPPPPLAESVAGDPPEDSMRFNAPTNLILYGPPGTGKTYALQQLQARYVEVPAAQDRDAWLVSLVADYGWREILAVVLSVLGSTNVPEIRDHELVTAKVRERKAPNNVSNRVWGVLQRHTPPGVKTVEFANRAGPYLFTKAETPIWSLLPEWETADERAAELKTLYAAGQKAAPPSRHYRQITFHPSFSYEDFVRGIRPVAVGDGDRTEFRPVDGVFKQLCDEARAKPTKRFALFIDEINRGNIAKIFGELITLIEPDKRLVLSPDGTVLSGTAVQLPGGGGAEIAEAPFGVPANLDIYGTMNTADRSIALLDIALRRRFEFREVPPQYGRAIFPETVDGVDCSRLLERINDRLEFLLDRDHRIGHAYLMWARTLDDLRDAFAKRIIPLLQEYFFDDLGKVALTLTGRDGTSPFVFGEPLRSDQLFPGSRRNIANTERWRYLITDPATWMPEAFVAIYGPPAGGESGSNAEEV